jgi:hypothetical protein
MKTLLFIILLLPSLVFAQDRMYTEAQYQQIWCDFNNGKSEVILPDGTRADCLTTKNVVEVDFANKWYEAIGQSLHYATHFNTKRAGILLLIENHHDYRHVDRMNHVIEYYKLPIDVWIMDATEVAKHIDRKK